MMFMLQLIPRTIFLDPNGKQLLLWPIKEIETLRADMVELNNKKLVKGEMVEIKGITVAQVLLSPQMMQPLLLCCSIRYGKFVYT